MDDQQRIALVESKTRDTNHDPSPAQLIRYQFGNYLGSASLELDENAHIISYEEYSPYGSTVYQAVDKTIKAAAKRYRYTGKERDEETGLNYHGARYYAPWLGRWVSCDLIWNEHETNLYQYAKNTPITHFDTDGMRAKQKINRFYVGFYDESFPYFKQQAKQWTDDHQGLAYSTDSNKIHEILKKIALKNPKKSLVIYFFGHGIEGQVSTNSSWMSSRTILNVFRGIKNIGIIAFMACSCGAKGGLAA